MGRNKAFAVWRGRTLLDCALDSLGRVSPKVCIVGPRSHFGRFGEVVEDRTPSQGPLGAIHSALLSSETDLNLIIAVDQPLIPSQLLNYLIERAGSAEAIVTAPRLSPQGWQPLCGVYRREFAACAEKALLDGHFAIHPLLDGVRALAVTEAELAARGFPSSVFLNINTPDDLDLERAE
jgi:molybdopterin-guanine dinucleotide biosynthesis protein A